MRHGAVVAALGVNAFLGLATVTQAAIELENVQITSYQLGALDESAVEVPGRLDLRLDQLRPDGSLGGVLSQGTKRLQVQAALRGCGSSTARVDWAYVDSFNWGEVRQGKQVKNGSVMELLFVSATSPSCTLVVTLPKPPPPPTGPGSFTTRPKPPEPIVLRPSSNDPGPGGDEPPEPGRSTEGAPPPPERR
jgi:hypothetical protein